MHPKFFQRNRDLMTLNDLDLTATKNHPQDIWKFFDQRIKNPDTAETLIRHCRDVMLEIGKLPPSLLSKVDVDVDFDHGYFVLMFKFRESFLPFLGGQEFPKEAVAGENSRIKYDRLTFMRVWFSTNIAELGYPIEEMSDTGLEQNLIRDLFRDYSEGLPLHSSLIKPIVDFIQKLEDMGLYGESESMGRDAFAIQCYHPHFDVSFEILGSVMARFLITSTNSFKDLELHQPEPLSGTITHGIGPFERMQAINHLDAMETFWNDWKELPELISVWIAGNKVLLRFGGAKGYVTVPSFDPEQTRLNLTDITRLVAAGIKYVDVREAEGGQVYRFTLVIEDEPPTPL